MTRLKIPLAIALTSAAAASAIVALAAFRPAPHRAACAADNGGLTLAPGLCATTFASGLAAPRQVAVAENGDVYVAMSGVDGGIAALRDTDGDGVADVSKQFGPAAGNGVAIGGGYLYFATNTKVVRWKMKEGELVPSARMETIVTRLPAKGNHTTKSVAVLGNSIIVSVGSATNSCQQQDRKKESPGIDPCVETATRAGLWKFSASRHNQTQASGVRYASGIRNAVGLTVRPGSNEVFATQHGRDQLSDNWGFTAERNAENPAEELLSVNSGDDFGWPYCYYDTDAKSLVLAPEYGGDGKTIGRCAKAKEPVAAFPAHWAPDAVVFAKPRALGDNFGDGVFVAFHGSWNRAPLPQAGYRVVFQPLDGLKSSGDYTTVAVSTAGDTDLRPAGLAVAPDGSLFIAADKNSRVWRVTKAN